MTFDLSGLIKTPLTKIGMSAPTYLPNISSVGQSTTKRIAGQTHKQTDLLPLVVLYETSIFISNTIVYKKQQQQQTNFRPTIPGFPLLRQQFV